MTVINVVTPFHNQVISENIKECILERSLTNIMSLMNTFHNTIVSKYIKHVLERNFMNVKQLGESFAFHVQLQMYEIIHIEENPSKCN